jgi:amino acid transporter
VKLCVLCGEGFIFDFPLASSAISRTLNAATQSKPSRRAPQELSTTKAVQQNPPANPAENRSTTQKKSAHLTLWPLVAATFFMVSGGTYGTEDIVHGAGYGRAIIILLLTPLLWSLPTTFMIGELSAALPCEGGYYAWVRQAMGNFWGFQEAWLSLAASIFDMAIYPALFVAYLSRLLPWFSIGHRGVIAGLAVVIACTVLNIAGVKVVSTTSLWLFFLLSAPFALIVVMSPVKYGALFHSAPSTSNVGLIGGMLVCMWNYMGWDNASTIAAEVDQPQRTYPRAMMLSVLIVALSYVLPVVAVWMTRLPAASWETGSWADIAGMLGGPALRVFLIAGGMFSGFAMFNALVMSYSRLPLAMSQDGMLPKFFGKLHPRTRAPWVAIVVLAVGWAMCLGLGFERLVTLDILIYGLSLGLEFAALVALRIRKPDLNRPFRVPGGLIGAIAIGIPPMLLLGFDMVQSQSERVWGMSSFAFGAIVIAAGVVGYYLTCLFGRQRSGNERPLLTNLGK